MRLPGEGLRRAPRQVLALLAPRPYDALQGRLPCGPAPLGFLEALAAGLAAACLLGQGADRGDLGWESPSHALAMAPPPTLQVPKVIRVADGADTLGDLRALSGAAVVCLARRFDVLHHLVPLRGRRCGTTWLTLCRHAGGGMEPLWDVAARFFRLHAGLCGSPLCGSQGGRDRLAPCRLPMAEVWRVRRSQGRCHIGQKPRCCIAWRLDDPTVATRKGLLQAGMPGVVSAGASRLRNDHGVAHGFQPPQRQPAWKRFILCERDGFPRRLRPESCDSTWANLVSAKSDVVGLGDGQYLCRHVNH
jgi:hypothetical protein